MKPHPELIEEIKNYFNNGRKLSVPFLQKKWKLSYDMAFQIIKLLNSIGKI